MNAQAIWTELEKVEAQLDLVESTWGNIQWEKDVPASVHVYMLELFRERNRLIESYRRAVAA